VRELRNLVATIAAPADYARFRSDYKTLLARRDQAAQSRRREEERYAQHTVAIERRAAADRVLLKDLAELYLKPGTLLRIPVVLAWTIAYPEGRSAGSGESIVTLTRRVFPPSPPPPLVISAIKVVFFSAHEK